MTKQLLLHQEVLLLALCDGTGKFSSGMYLYSVAGAMLSELMILGRISLREDKLRSVALVDDKPTDCELLDELLAQINGSEKDRGLQDWISVAAGIKDLNHRLAASLCDLGILQQDERKALFIFTQRVYPELDGTCEDSIRRRMADVMFYPDTKADTRTSALIALSYHAGLLKANFAPDQLQQHRTRIKELASGEHLASDATKAAIEASQAAIFVATMVPVMVASAASS